MPDQSVVVVITYHAQPGKGDVLYSELADLIRTVVSEERDCLGIELLRDVDDETRILLYERWTSREAYTGPHMQTPHIQAFIGRAPGFAAGPPTITFWRLAEDVAR